MPEYKLQFEDETDENIDKHNDCTDVNMGYSYGSYTYARIDSLLYDCNLSLIFSLIKFIESIIFFSSFFSYSNDISLFKIFVL